MHTWRLWLAGLLAAFCVGGAFAAPPGPRVDGVDVEEVPSLAPGTPLRFTVYGSPGGQASLRIEGVHREVALAEVEPGLYEGTHVVQPHEPIAPSARVVADLRRGERIASALLEEPLVLGAAPPGTAPDADPRGTVQAVTPVQVPGEAGYVGAVAGGVIGAVLGNQVGRGDGRTLARILGAVGGAYAGREIERAHRQRTQYDVVLRLDDGSMQRRRYSDAPPWRAGDRVRLVQDRWVRDDPAERAERRPIAEAGLF